ncbi:MAG: CoA-binding protein [archaeon]|nr:CoA-binding protein [archaeon]
MASIAILGASANREKFGNKCVRAYKKLGWEVFPINPKEEKIEGVKCYPNLLALAQRPDRVSVYLPPKITQSLIAQFKDAGIDEVILNPGAQSDELISALEEQGIVPVLVCSIRLEGISPSTL